MLNDTINSRPNRVPCVVFFRLSSWKSSINNKKHLYNGDSMTVKSSVATTFSHFANFIANYHKRRKRWRKHEEFALKWNIHIHGDKWTDNSCHFHNCATVLCNNLAMIKKGVYADKIRILVSWNSYFPWRWNKVSLIIAFTMGLLPDTQNCGLRMRRECRERFPRHRG